MNIEAITQICESYPSVTTDIKWGNMLVFSVLEKMFFVISLDQIPCPAKFKTTDEEYMEKLSNGLKTREYKTTLK